MLSECGSLNFMIKNLQWQISDFSPSRFFYPSRFFIHLKELLAMSKKLHITYPQKYLQNFLEILRGSKQPLFRFSILLNWGHYSHLTDTCYKDSNSIENFREKSEICLYKNDKKSIKTKFEKKEKFQPGAEGFKNTSSSDKTTTYIL